MKGYADIVREHTKKIWDKKNPDIQMEKMKATIQEKYGVSFKTDRDFHKWSVQNYANFWEEMWNFYGIIHSKPYNQVVKRTGDRIVDVEWFSGAKLNYAENILRYRDDHIALLIANEIHEEERITFAEMFEEVRLYAAAFRKNGLKVGDRVGCYMSNKKEAIFAMLAAISIGAIFGGPPVFYGAKEASLLFKEVEPKFLMAVDRYYIDEGEVDNLEKLATIMDDNKTIEKVIVVSSKKNFKLNIANVIKNCWSLEEFLDSGRNLDGTIPDLEFEQLPFMTPALFIFTSGSTCLPKGVIQSAGVFLTFFRDIGLQCDLGRDDVILQEDCVGWATWNFFVSSLGLGVTLLLTDNGKCFSYSHHFWDIVDKRKVSVLFFSPKVLDTLVRKSIVPSPDVTLDHLKIIVVGGSIVALKPFDYILKNVKSDVFVGTVYGQSETMMTSGFYLNTPVYSAEIQCPALGVDVKVLDSQGNNLIGKPGELVVSSPTPSMALTLWNDLDGQRFNDTYLSKFSGAWAMNDEGYVDPNTEGIIVIGRSDSVLCYFDGKFGSGEIYWAIDDIEEIEDSICVSQRNSIGDIQFVLFVRMKKDHVFNQKLVKKIQKNIMEKLMPSRVPKVILPIKDIPYNINGKKMEPLVREILLTNQVPPAGNIRNPECLLEYCNIPEILKFAASGK